jgi:hypothetical protein
MGIGPFLDLWLNGKLRKKVLPTPVTVAGGPTKSKSIPVSNVRIISGQALSTSLARATVSARFGLARPDDSASFKPKSESERAIDTEPESTVLALSSGTVKSHCCKGRSDRFSRSRRRLASLNRSDSG